MVIKPPSIYSSRQDTLETQALVTNTILARLQRLIVTNSMTSVSVCLAKHVMQLEKPNIKYTVKLQKTDENVRVKQNEPPYLEGKQDCFENESKGDITRFYEIRNLNG